MPLDEIYVTYLNGQSRGRLATVSPDGRPQNKPVGYRGVALAQISRAALSPDGQPVEPSSDLTGPFSEMALYVLVRRAGT